MECNFEDFVETCREISIIHAIYFTGVSQLKKIPFWTSAVPKTLMGFRDESSGDHFGWLGRKGDERLSLFNEEMYVIHTFLPPTSFLGKLGMLFCFAFFVLYVGACGSVRHFPCTA